MICFSLRLFHLTSFEKWNTISFANFHHLSILSFTYFVYNILYLNITLCRRSILNIIRLTELGGKLKPSWIWWFQALCWLKSYYWEPQEKAIPFQGDISTSIRKEIKSKLRGLAFNLEMKQNPQLESAVVKPKRMYLISPFLMTTFYISFKLFCYFVKLSCKWSCFYL